MNTIVIIQARMGSSRLPGKILKPLSSNDVLTYVVERSKRIEGVSEVIVATSRLPQDDLVEEWCGKKDVPFYRGSEEDVLDRFIQAAKPYNPDYVIRVTADCPFVDYELGSEMVKEMAKNQVDFIQIEGSLPRGLAVELFSYLALKYMNEHGKESRHREHVTYYGYEHNDKFSWTTIEAKKEIQEPQLRITLDTEEDYELCQRVAENFNGELFVSSADVVRFLKANPDVAKINAHIEQKPVV